MSSDLVLFEDLDVSLQKKLEKIKIFFLDVDGTLSDGKLYYAEDLEQKSFSTRDGLGIVVWQRLGGVAAIISGRHSEAVNRRAKELGISEVHLGIHDKRKCALEILKRLDLKPEQSACVGDDLNDLALFDLCAVGFVPSNAALWMRDFAQIVLHSKGGEGCVREAIDLVLTSQNLKDKVLGYFKK